LAVAFLALGTMAARGGLSYWNWLKGEMVLDTRGLDWETAEGLFRKSVAWSGWNDQAMTALGDLRATQAVWHRDSDAEEERKGKAALAREAEEWFGRALSVNPFNLDALYGMGRAKQAAGDAEGALEWKKKATDAAPTYRFYQNQYAVALRRAGRVEEAKAFLEERKKFAGLGDRGAKIMQTVEREAKRAEK
jgi:tetratricopeptide (TPR) repeat protein